MTAQRETDDSRSIDSVNDSEGEANRKRKREPRREPLRAVDNGGAANVIRLPPSTKRRRVAAWSTKPSSAVGVGNISHALQTILRCKRLSDIHPSAHVRNNRVVIPSVSVRTYRFVRGQLPTISSSKRIRLEHSSSASSCTRDELIVTMPTQIHEVLKGFASEIKAQMFAKDSLSGRSFIPPRWGTDRVLETGSSTLHLEHGSKRLTVEPDASLAFESNNPFLVLEVAVTQNARSVKMKAQDYILGSGGRVAFVVVITVSRRNKRNTGGDGRDHGRDQIRQGQHLDSTSDLENNETNGAMSEGGAGPVAKAMQQELTVGDQRRISSSPISTLTDPPSDLSLWNVFTKLNPEAKQDSPRRASESICLPPLLYSALDSGDTLNVGDTVHASVFKSVC